MKKMIKALLALLMVTSLVACSTGSTTKETAEPTAASNKLEEILSKGKIVVATSPDYAPMKFIDPSKTGQDQYIGSDISLAYYIGEQLGVDVEIAAMDFSTVLSSVDLGKADVAISGFGWKEETGVFSELFL